MREIEPVNCDPNARMNATATHPHSAFENTVAQSTPANSPMIR